MANSKTNYVYTNAYNGLYKIKILMFFTIICTKTKLFMNILRERPHRKSL